jgi:hypothetical protein
MEELQSTETQRKKKTFPLTAGNAVIVKGILSLLQQDVPMSRIMKALLWMLILVCCTGKLVRRRTRSCQENSGLKEDPSLVSSMRNKVVFCKQCLSISKSRDSPNNAYAAETCSLPCVVSRLIS